MAERTPPATVTAPTRLSARELRRYSRHLLIPDVALAGQERLAAARVLVIGAGGLGSPALEYLAAAGVGRIGIADDDTVDETNLQRQTIFATDDVGKKKTDAAAARVRAINPHVAVDPIPVRVDATNARDLVRVYDVVLDCTDRFASRYLVNDACVAENRADVYASIFRFDGQVSVFNAGTAPHVGERGPCYRCLYPEAPPEGSVPTCAEGGVLGVLAGMVGTWQANEALKLLLHIGTPLIGRLLLVDALGARTKEVRFTRDPLCTHGTTAPVIGASKAAHVIGTSEATHVIGASEAAHVVILSEASESERSRRTAAEIDASQLDTALQTATLLDVREPHEVVLGIIDGAVHIPASQLEARMHELDSANDYVVACRIGAKSLWAAQRLHDAGFRRVRHLRGGLLRYAVTHETFPFF